MAADGRWSSTPRALVVLLCLVVVLVAWSMSSPAGSAPDGDYHLATIWCGAGQRAGQCERSDLDTHFQVPRGILRYSGPLGHFCFVGNPGASAGCLSEIDGSTSTAMESTGRLDVSLTRTAFAQALEIFVNRDVETSVLRMRLFNGLLLVVMLASVVVLTPRSAESLALMWLVIGAPLGLYVVVSAHPQSWVFTLIPTALALLATEIDESGGRGRYRRAIARLLGFGSLAAAVVARPSDSYLIVGVVVIALTLVHGRGRSGVRYRGVWIAALLGSSYLVILRRFGGIGGLWSRAQYASSVDEMWINAVDDAPRAFLDIFGGATGLGSSDVLTYGISPILGVILATLVVVAVVPRCTPITAWTTASLALLPMLWLWRIAPIGISGRYGWVLAAIALTYYFLECRPGGVVISEMPRAARRVIVASAGLANAFALHAHIRRYVTGSDVVGWNLNRDAEWWWPFGPAPMTTWLLGSAAFALAAGLVMFPERRPA